MKACGITDVGLQRHENQDTFAVERGAADGQLIAVVCDGMGGENCGQIASSLAVRAFLDELHAVLRADMTTEQLREAVSFCVSKANAAVNRHAQDHTECHGMGTTLVSAVTNGSGAVICNVGTRALGPEEHIECDVYDVTLGADERLLLCSDGLVVTATDEEMYEAVGRGDTPEESLEHLLELSKQRGAPDNVTAVLLYHE